MLTQHPLDRRPSLVQTRTSVRQDLPTMLLSEIIFLEVSHQVANCVPIVTIQRRIAVLCGRVNWCPVRLRCWLAHCGQRPSPWTTGRGGGIL